MRTSQTTVLDELDLSEAGALQQLATEGGRRAVDFPEALIRSVVAAAIWRWWRANQERRIKVQIWIFRPSVRVGELRDLITWLVGPEPVTAGLAS